MTPWIEFGLLLLGWFLRGLYQQLRKDLNGIGDKGRQTELKLFYVAMMLCPEENRQEVLNALVRRLT